MKFKHKVTGIIYNVTNPEVLPLYNNSEAYEPVVDKKPEPKKAKKSED